MLSIITPPPAHEALEVLLLAVLFLLAIRAMLKGEESKGQ
jgi:hypothetical protein